MYSSSVSGFLNKVNQGVKPNLFVVDVQYPTSFASVPADAALTNMLCKSAALPASNLGVIEVPYRGRTVKIAGDRTFDTWTATFINDRNFLIRSAMEKWMSEINSHDGNRADRHKPANDSTGYTAHLLVKQLERDGQTNASILRQYKLWYCFPTNVSQIDLAYDSNDQIEDFTVEFQVQYWTVENSGVTLSTAGVGTPSGVEIKDP